MRWLALLPGVLLVSALFAVQPALTFPPPKVVPPDEETLAQITSLRGKLTTAIDRLRRLGVRDPALADIEIYREAERRITQHNEFYKNSGKDAVTVLEEGLLRASQQARGETPWLAAMGQTVPRAYRSRIDGSLQPFAVTYPHDYGKDRTRRYRLDVVLHGRDAGLTEVSFLHRHGGGKPAPAQQGWVQIDIFGRGNNAYRWAGESDVYEAVENFFAVESLLGRGVLLDPTRVVLRGYSMGGAGTWHLGLHRPDQWVCLGPGAGFTTTHGYVARLPEKLPEHQEACLHIYDAVDYAENIANVPVVAYNGGDDGQLASARNIEKALEPLGLSITHFVAPKMGHRAPPPEFRNKIEAEYAKHAERGRAEYPDKVRFVTYTLRYPSCHWVSLLALEQHYQKARVEAERKEDSLTATTTNVAQLRLALWPGATREPITVQIDGQKLTVPPHQARSGELAVYLEKREGKWASVLPERLAVERLRKPRKQSGLQGPIDDAFTAPFVCVRPTGKAWHEATAEYTRADLERFRAEWAKYLRGDLPIKDDVDVTAEDIATRHLILFGDPGSNRLIEQALPGLPLRWTEKQISLAGKEVDAAKHVPVLIYPSPLASDRYVVLNSGHTFHAPEFQGTNALLYPRLGDHALLELKGNKMEPLTVEVLQAGLFDEFWQPRR